MDHRQPVSTRFGVAPKPWLAALLASTCLALAPTPARAEDVAWVWFSSAAPPAFHEIAVLTRSLLISGERIETHHRMRGLDVERGVQVTPTVHVHQDLSRPAPLGKRHAAAIEAAVLAAARQSTSKRVQLDFEALDSQRTFYVELVKSLRAALPAAIRLSVTVRAGWCDQPALLDSLAADEVVPMFFRMGEATEGYRERLAAAPESLAPRCRRAAIGLARQEPVPDQVVARYQRRYWFNYKDWNNLQGR